MKPERFQFPTHLAESELIKIVDHPVYFGVCVKFMPKQIFWEIILAWGVQRTQKKVRNKPVSCGI